MGTDIETDGLGGGRKYTLRERNKRVMEPVICLARAEGRANSPSSSLAEGESVCTSEHYRRPQQAKPVSMARVLGPWATTAGPSGFQCSCALSCPSLYQDLSDFLIEAFSKVGDKQPASAREDGVILEGSKSWGLNVPILFLLR